MSDFPVDYHAAHGDEQYCGYSAEPGAQIKCPAGAAHLRCNLREEDLNELNIEDGVEDAIEAIYLYMELEIEELKQIISLAKQAQF